MAQINEGDWVLWQAAPPALPQATAADLARLREAERAADLATCEVLRALIAHYGGWERVPRKRRGFFADSTAEQIAEYIVRIERELSQGS
jgi:hypothetical protein